MVDESFHMVKKDQFVSNHQNHREIFQSDSALIHQFEQQHLPFPAMIPQVEYLVQQERKSLCCGHSKEKERA